MVEGGEAGGREGGRTQGQVTNGFRGTSRSQEASNLAKKAERRDSEFKRPSLHQEAKPQEDPILSDPTQPLASQKARTMALSPHTPPNIKQPSERTQFFWGKDPRR